MFGINGGEAIIILVVVIPLRRTFVVLVALLAGCDARSDALFELLKGRGDALHAQ